MNRYANGLLFGPAAVLLQVAHPRVVQGVADHSDFREDALGNLRQISSTLNCARSSDSLWSQHDR